MVAMNKWGEVLFCNRTVLLRLAAAAILALFVAGPGWAQVGFTVTNIGPPPVAGSVVVNADGSWTVMASGNAFNDNTADQLLFVHRTVNGDGSAFFRLAAQAPSNGGGGQYVGLMVRATVAPGSVFAGPIMSTTAVNFIHRDATDQAGIRDTGDTAKYRFPKHMMVQRVGNAIQAFESDDGRIWDVVKPPLELTTLPAATQVGFALSSRGSVLVTAQVSGVQVLEGVTSVSGVESAATNNLAFLAWRPITAATGYNVYRGDKDATFDKMTMVGTVAAGPDPFYVDNKTSPTPLRTLSYVVVGVFKATDGKLFEGPAVRAR